MVLLETEKTYCPHNKIWSREAKSLHPILSQPNVICTSYEETAPGLANEMSCHDKYSPQESQEHTGRLLTAKGWGQVQKTRPGTRDLAIQTVALLFMQNPNSQLSCSPPGYTAVLEHFYMLDFCFFSFARTSILHEGFCEVLTIVRAVSAWVWCIDVLAGGFS